MKKIGILALLTLTFSPAFAAPSCITFLERFEIELAKLDEWNLVFSPKERAALLAKDAADQAARKQASDVAHGSDVAANGQHGDTTYGKSGPDNSFYGNYGGGQHGDSHGGHGHGDMHGGSSGGYGPGL